MSPLIGTSLMKELIFSVVRGYSFSIQNLFSTHPKISNAIKESATLT